MARRGLAYKSSGAGGRTRFSGEIGGRPSIKRISLDPVARQYRNSDVCKKWFRVHTKRTHNKRGAFPVYEIIVITTRGSTSPAAAGRVVFLRPPKMAAAATTGPDGGRREKNVPSKREYNSNNKYARRMKKKQKPPVRLYINIRRPSPGVPVSDSVLWAGIMRTHVCTRYTIPRSLGGYVRTRTETRKYLKKHVYIYTYV